MGVCVIVLGKSGSGKSASLREFHPDEVGVLNVLGKPLPFRGRLMEMGNPSYQTIERVLASGKRRSWVVDDAGYLMQNENFERAGESGYQKFTEMAQHFYQLVRAAQTAPRDTITYLLMHPETDQFGGMKVKSIGRMLDEKFCIEGAVPVLIGCEVREGRHVFVTESDGQTLYKAPMGCLPPVMDNDLRAVDAALRDYWGLDSPDNDKED